MRRRLDELEQYAIEVILDKRHGFRATLLRVALQLLSFLYLAIVQARLYLYRKRILKERQLGCLVISIGNLTVGGTGKTPVVEKFARALQKGGRRVAILSRGYKSVDRRRKKTLWEKSPCPKGQKFHQESFRTERAFCWTQQRRAMNRTCSPRISGAWLSWWIRIG